MSIRQTLLSAITIAELQTMIHKARDPDGKAAYVRRAILRFTAVDFGELAARHYGEMRSHLERRGRRIVPMGLLIAAHARSLAAIFVTDNLREFSRVPGLASESWLR